MAGMNTFLGCGTTISIGGQTIGVVNLKINLSADKPVFCPAKNCILFDVQFEIDPIWSRIVCSGRDMPGMNPPPLW